MATVRQIAAEAGLSPRVVQYYFTNKHHLLVTALRMLHRRRTRADVRRTLDHHLDRILARA